MSAPTHADGMLFMEYYKLWDSPLDGEAWTRFRQLREEGAFADYETFSAAVPRTARDFVLWDRVCCSFEQAGVLMRNGLLHPDLYFEGWAAPTGVWKSVEPVVMGMRQKNPEAYKNFEWIAGRYTEWLAARDAAG